MELELVVSHQDVQYRTPLAVVDIVPLIEHIVSYIYTVSLLHSYAISDLVSQPILFVLVLDASPSVYDFLILRKGNTLTQEV